MYSLVIFYKIPNKSFVALPDSETRWIYSHSTPNYLFSTKFTNKQIFSVSSIINCLVWRNWCVKKQDGRLVGVWDGKSWASMIVQSHHVGISSIIYTHSINQSDAHLKYSFYKYIFLGFLLKNRRGRPRW